MRAEQDRAAPGFVDADPGQLKVFVLSGAPRLPSHTLALAQTVAAGLLDRGLEVFHWSLRDDPLPFADPKYHDDPSRNNEPIVRQLVNLATEADAFVLASPVYHNSYAGVLKNALDSLAIPQFLYKPVGLLSHGGLRDTQAVDHLRLVVRGLLGIATPTQICTRDADYEERDGGYSLVAPDILGRVERFNAELTLFAHQFRLSRQAAVRRPGAGRSDAPRRPDRLAVGRD